MAGGIWLFDREARLLALAARIEALRDRWRRELRGCTDPEARIRIARHLRALRRRARWIEVALQRPGAVDESPEPTTQKDTVWTT